MWWEKGKDPMLGQLSVPDMPRMIKYRIRVKEQDFILTGIQHFAL